jgi:hypothetical protein
MRYFLAVMTGLVLAAAAAAQQFTPPALPSGVKAGSETAEGEVVKVYSLEDQGAKYRSYAVKYKGGEVIVTDMLAMSNNKVGDKITFIVARVQAPVAGNTVQVMSFSIVPFNMPKAPNVNLPNVPKKKS